MRKGNIYKSLYKKSYKPEYEINKLNYESLNLDIIRVR